MDAVALSMAATSGVRFSESSIEHAAPFVVVVADLKFLRFSTQRYWMERELVVLEISTVTANRFKIC